MMICLLKGYTGYAFIEDVSAHMTSYSLSMNQNVIESGGIGRIYNNGYFNRWKLDAVADYSQYDLSITCEANSSILIKALYMMYYKFHSSNSVKFYDDSIKIYLEYSNANLTSIELSVGIDAVATITFGFVTFGNNISVYYGEGGYNLQAKRNAPSSLVGDCLMPYWAWGVAYTRKEENDEESKLVFGKGLCDFSFSYQQSVTPKYGCCASTSTKAVGPKAIVFGLPNVTWSLTYAMVESVNTYYNIASNKIALCGDKLEFKYQKKNTKSSQDTKTEAHIYFYDVYTTSYSPSVGNSGDVNKLTVSGMVFGTMSYSVNENAN